MQFFNSKSSHLIIILVIQVITISFGDDQVISVIENLNSSNNAEVNFAEHNVKKEASLGRTEQSSVEENEIKNVKSLDDRQTINYVNNKDENIISSDYEDNFVKENIKSSDTENIISIVNIGIDDNVIKSQDDVNGLKSSADNETLHLENTYPKEITSFEKINSNKTISENKSSNVTKYICTQDIEHGPVELVNATRLVDIIKEFTTNKNKNGKDKDAKLQPAPCLLVMFYATWCIFSSQAAPHFNALPKFFPHIKFVAIDAMKYQHFNSYYGIVGVPTLMLLHDGKPAAKFNEKVYSLETFAKFVTQLTTLNPNGSLHVTSADFSGPVSSVPVAETDYCLILSWIFITVCAMYYTSQSQWWRQFVESVQNTWRESNAQHEHVD